jgi:hypothetical protein
VYKRQTQRTGPRSGEGHPEWKGGRIVDKDGYVLLYRLNHPMGRKHGNYIFEHRLVVSESLQRPLSDSEVVHHLNGDKTDNRIENLQLFSCNAEHLKHELSGNVPNWSDEGKLALRSAVDSLAYSRRGLKYDGSKKHLRSDHF